MAINFPPSPSVGDLWPAPPATPRWRFSGIAWLPAPVVVPPDQSVTGNLSVADDVDIGGDVMIAGDLRADGDVQFDTLRVINQATFNDGVEIDGEQAATREWVDSELTDIKNMGFFAGSFATHAALPTNTSALPNLTVNDFVTVVADETHAGATTRYIATAIAGNGDIVWTYDITYSTDVTGKMDKVPAATQGHVAIFDNAGQVEDAGSDLQASTLQFRPMTANLYNWIPIGLEGTFVGEGTNIINAPTNGPWRYLAFARASGSLDLIAFENAGGPMRASPSGQSSQRTVRKKRMGGGTLPTDNWSSSSGAPGLPPGWGEYQRPLFSTESAGGPFGGSLMKIAGRNLLYRVPGGNIQIGPRQSGPATIRNPSNMNVSHRRLIYTGASGTIGNNRMHLMENIWNLRRNLLSSWMKTRNTRVVITSIPADPRLAPLFNITVPLYESINDFKLPTYRYRFIQNVAGPYRIWGVINLQPAWPMQNAQDRRIFRARLILDFRSFGGGSTWTVYGGRQGTLATPPHRSIQYRIRNMWRSGTMRVGYTPSLVDRGVAAPADIMLETWPANKVYIIDIEMSPSIEIGFASMRAFDMHTQYYSGVPC